MQECSGWAKKPAASDQTEIVLQIFEDGQFVEYVMERVSNEVTEKGTLDNSDGQFAIVDEKLSDSLLGSDQLRGRLKVSIKGKPLSGIIERHGHDEDHDVDHHVDHNHVDHNDTDHDDTDHNDHNDHDDHDDHDDDKG